MKHSPISNEEKRFELCFYGIIIFKTGDLVLWWGISTVKLQWLPLTAALCNTSNSSSTHLAACIFLGEVNLVLAWVGRLQCLPTVCSSRQAVSCISTQTISPAKPPALAFMCALLPAWLWVFLALPASLICCIMHRIVCKCERDHLWCYRQCWE